MTQIIVASRKENKLSDYNTRDLGKGRVVGLKKRKREPSLAFAGYFFTFFIARQQYYLILGLILRGGKLLMIF